MTTDWDSAVRKPPQHRVNKDGVLDGQDCYTRKHTFVCILILLSSFLLMLFYMPNEHHCKLNVGRFWPYVSQKPYNSTYPLTTPVVLDDGTCRYRIAIITDLDVASKVPNQEHMWRSYMRKGYLTVHSNSNSGISIDWDSDMISVKSTLSQGGRGMELSDLKVFNGHLTTVDDRTGVVYKILGKKAVAHVLLNDGDGEEPKGFKGEWLAVKDEVLYVGGLGKEWTTTDGAFVNFNPMFVKTVSPTGHVQHHNWTDRYVDMRAAAGIQYPGYMIHESAQWSAIHQKWFFLPRRASTSMYSEKTDERSATNFLLIADESFSTFEVKKVGQLSLTRGFSAFQFIPNTNDRLIVALKSEEDNGHIASYIVVFDWMDLSIVFPETKLEGGYKFEGIEFI